LILRGETGLSGFYQAGWKGYLWMILAVIGITIGNIYARRYLKDADIIDVSTIQISVATIASLAVTLAFGNIPLQGLKLSGFLTILYTGIFGTCLVFFLNFYVVKYFGATAVSLTAYISPVSAVILGAVLLDEVITLVILLGMFLIFLGLALMNRKPKNHITLYHT